MKLKRILAAAAALTLLIGSALADGSMTKDELKAIWQASFTKMNTTGQIHAIGLPGKNDLSYEEALSIAREAIFDQYGTPAEELDAMGVYPDFYAAEGDYSASWRFYFTPIKDMDIDEGHDTPPQGEYRVYLDSPSGEVTFVNWYNDNFWAYAQRTWDAGKHDEVYARAQRSGFYSQTTEQQEHFLTLMKDAGYDVSAIASGAALWDDVYFRLDLNFGDETRAVDPADDPIIAAAWKAIEDAYGLDGALMRQYAYISFYSPMNTGATDVYIAYNYNVEWAMMGRGELSYWQDLLFTYVTRLGYYLVRFDPATGEVIATAHRDRDDEAQAVWDDSSLLGRRQWGAEDLIAFDAAFRKRTETMQAAQDRMLRLDELELISDELMREIGGDPTLYDSRREQEGDIGLEAGHAIATEAARQAALAEEGLTAEAFDAEYSLDEGRYDPTRGVYEYWFYSNRQDEYEYYVTVDASTGEVKDAKVVYGLG